MSADQTPAGREVPMRERQDVRKALEDLLHDTTPMNHEGCRDTAEAILAALSRSGGTPATPKNIATDFDAQIGEAGTDGLTHDELARCLMQLSARSVGIVPATISAALNTASHRLTALSAPPAMGDWREKLWRAIDQYAGAVDEGTAEQIVAAQKAVNLALDAVARCSRAVPVEPETNNAP